METTTMTNSQAMAVGIGAGIGMGMMIFIFAIVAFMIVCWWKVFTKAGKPGWAAIIPIYNIIVMLEIAGKPWWWIFLFLIPIANIVFLIMMYNGVSKNFGHGAGFTVGLIFLSIIFVPILAFGNSKYVGAGGATPSTPAA